jgi:tRNA-splicing endonuclease subunit Sen2
MKGQLARANKSRVTSEELTRQRREERQQAKWERARKEREAIDQKLFEEAGVLLKKELISPGNSASTEEQVLVGSDTSLTISKSTGDAWAKCLDFFPSPVGPIELLSLPNSISDLEKWAYNDEPASPPDHLEGVVINGSPSSSNASGLFHLGSQTYVETKSHNISNGHLHTQNGIVQDAVDVGKKEPNLMIQLVPSELSEGPESPDTSLNGTTGDSRDNASNGSVQSDDTVFPSSGFTPNGSALTSGTSGTPGRSRIKCQKSVRFSPTVERNTFLQSEPPSPDQGVATSTFTSVQVKEEPLIIQEQEHFQLMMEEAFFLSYGLGALTILDPSDNSPILNRDLFYLFRKSSYFPPQPNPVLSPDDSFLLNYVVYHHYRSLGWCVRGGAKFSCDFMLYNRGPVFSHAEYAILIIPSYTDPYWSSDPFLQNYVKGKEKRSWSWMHCINRVISQVKKKLILVYVDVPKPMDAEAERKLGIDEVLGKYRVREFVMRRWLSNRERE